MQAIPSRCHEPDLHHARAALDQAKANWARFGFVQVPTSFLRDLDFRLSQAEAEYRLLTRPRPEESLVLYVLKAGVRAAGLVGLTDREWWLVGAILGIPMLLAAIPLLLIARPPVVVLFLALGFVYLLASLLFAAILFPWNGVWAQHRVSRMEMARYIRAGREQQLARVIPTLRNELAQATETRTAEDWYRTARHRLASLEAIALEEEIRRAVAAQEEQARLAALLASKKYQLQMTDWRVLRGVPFEEFLAEVFRFLGYAVEATKASGDQGVDLYSGPRN